MDFHCHLDLFPDFEAAVKRAEAAKIYTLTVTTTPRAWPRNHELTRHTQYVRAALGLHPQLVAERYGELPLWKRFLSETCYVGEVGLDAGPQYYKSIDTQKEVFQTILECCAEAGGKILTVHSVRSVPIVLEMIERYLPKDRGIVVLHWFTGNQSDARRAADLGCYFSINAEMTRSDRGQALIASLPANRLLVETDGPFTKINGRPSEPHDVHVVEEALGRVRGVSIQAISNTISSNLRSLLSQGQTM